MKTADKKIKIFAPATVSNVGPGFDIFGFALNKPGDIVEVEIFPNQNFIKIKNSDNNKFKIPITPSKNTAGIAVRAMLRALNLKLGVKLLIQKGYGVGTGLGSSAASAAAAVIGLNKLLGNPFTKKQLVNFAMEGEKISAGSVHADNVAPSILGGFTLIKSYNPLEIIKIKTQLELNCAIVLPEIVVNTKEARELLDKNITLENGIKQWGNTAALTYSLSTNNYNLLSQSLKDFIIENQRYKLIPHFYDVQKKAIENGALGCSISGSGPAIFALCKTKVYAERIGRKMQEVFASNSIESTVFISRLSKTGARKIR